MNATHMCKVIYQWIEEKQQYGKVHSIFKSTMNILSRDGKLISIILKDKPMSPYSIKLEKKLNFKELNIEIGEKIIFTKTSLFSKNIIVYYKDAILWDKKANLISNIDTYENFLIKLNLIKKFIYNKGNKNGIYKLMKFIPGDLYYSHNNNIITKSEIFIKKRFISFINGFKEYDIDYINNLSKRIIGFGVGLTPSMDDFLSGVMIANVYISYFLDFNLGNAYLLNNEIIKGIQNMTTLISEEMLKSASLGETNEDIRDLMTALVGHIDEKELHRILTRVISFGHSSGTDILCGIYTGSYILIEKHEESNDV